MPELAEVENVKRYLKENILNKKILDINILYPKMIENDINFFKEKLINNSFININRKGKYLIFELDKYFLISHLRMEGKFNIYPLNEKLNKHDHVIFYFDNFTLRYNDTRKFGRLKLINKNEIDNFFKNLGEDANNVKNIDLVYQKIIKSNKMIKTILLDQSIISGIGNIYADEILYKAKISPFKLGKNLSYNDVENIILSSKDILNKAIKCHGTTIKSYTFSLNHVGSYQNYLCAHKQSICKNCHNPIKIAKIGGRSTYYCENCQKM